MSGSSQNPDAIHLPPASFAVKLTKLALFPRDDDPDRTAALTSRISFLMSPSLTVALSLLSTRMHGSIGAPLASRKAKMKSPFRELLADDDPCPCPRLFRETNLLPLADTSDLRHLGFQLVIPFAKLSHFSQTIFDSAVEVIPVRMSRTQFILVAISDLCGSLRQFGFEARPSRLIVVCVLLLKQAEGFFSAELCYAGEVLDSEPIQNLGASECARARAQRALNGFGRRWWSRGHCPRR